MPWWCYCASCFSRFITSWKHAKPKMKIKAGFRNTQWDPFLLCTQIIAIQTVLYVNLGAIMALMDVFVDANHTLDHIFQYHVYENQFSIHSTEAIVHWWPIFDYLFAGNTHHRCRWPFGGSLICDQRISRCGRSAIHSAKNQAVSGFQLHLSRCPFDHLLVLQFSISIDVLLVVAQRCLRYAHVCLRWIFVPEKWAPGNSGWIFGAEHKRWSTIMIPITQFSVHSMWREDC